MHFSEEELTELMFDLGIDWENLEGDTKKRKIISLVGFYLRRNDIDTLIHWSSGKRKNIEWPETKLDKID